MQTVEFSDMYYNVNSRALLTRIYVEQEAWEPLLAHIEAFRAYLNRENNLAPYAALGFLQLLLPMKKLADGMLDIHHRNHTALAELHTSLLAEVEAASEFPYREWLLRYLRGKAMLVKS